MKILLHNRDRIPCALPEKLPFIQIGSKSASAWQPAGLAAGADQVYETIHQRLEQRGLDAQLSKTGCIGYCQQEPLVDVRLPGQGRVIYTQVTRPRARVLVDELARGDAPAGRCLGSDR